MGWSRNLHHLPSSPESWPRVAFTKYCKALQVDGETALTCLHNLSYHSPHNEVSTSWNWLDEIGIWVVAFNYDGWSSFLYTLPFRTEIMVGNGCSTPDRLGGWYLFSVDSPFRTEIMAGNGCSIPDRLGGRYINFCSWQGPSYSYQAHPQAYFQRRPNSM